MTTTHPAWLDGEFLTDAFFADPYPLYQRLLREATVAYSDKAGAWLVCPFQEVTAGLADSRLSSGARIPTLANALSPGGLTRNQPVLHSLALMMSFRDDPDHARLRRSVSKAFTPRAMTALEDEVRELVASLVDAFPQDRPFDLVEALAFPLPAMVICRLLGVPLEMLDRVRFWADAVVTLLSSAVMTDEAADRAHDAFQEADAYIREAVGERLGRPGTDLLSGLAQAQAEGTVSPDEVTAMVVLLLFAGFETTEGLIGNASRILLADRDWPRRLAADADRIPAFVEEVLRYDPSIHRQSRIALTDVAIRDVPIPRGSTILFMIGASGHDPARFARPEVFDPARPDAANIGFGHGPHFCLGAPLARMETRLALEALASLPQAMAPGGEATYGSLLAVRKPKEIPVRIGPPQPSSDQAA